MSRQTILDTCPFCGDRQTSPGYYDCGSVEKAGWYRHEICLERQIANLTATVAEQAAEIVEMRLNYDAARGLIHELGSWASAALDDPGCCDTLKGLFRRLIFLDTGINADLWEQGLA